jgi:hypothetical protein
VKPGGESGKEGPSSFLGFFLSTPLLLFLFSSLCEGNLLELSIDEMLWLIDSHALK